MATRQKSTNGKSKSPRVQVVLPEELCERLTTLAENESRTVSNMAKVLIMEGVKQMEASNNNNLTDSRNPNKKDLDSFISALEQQKPQRLKGAPRRLRFYKPSN